MKKNREISLTLIYPVTGEKLERGKHDSRYAHWGDNGRLFHDQTILYGFYPVDAPCDFNRFIDGLLRINEAAQLNGALVSFDTDLK
jgi:hypothetical protein